MRIWPFLVALGILGLASGCVLLLEGHHTLGLGGSALGALMLAAGGAMGYHQQGGSQPSPPQKTLGASQKRPQSKAIRNSILAVIVVLAIGAATFFVSVNLGTGSQSSQPGSTSSASSVSSSTTHPSQTSTNVNTGKQSVSSTTSTSVRTFTLASTTTSSGTSSTSRGTSTVSTTQAWPFNFTYSPVVIVVNNQAYLNVSYSSSLNRSVSVYEDATLYQGGTPATVGSPLATVAANGSVAFNLALGILTPGNYSVTFFLSESPSEAQLSGAASLDFTV